MALRPGAPAFVPSSAQTLMQTSGPAESLGSLKVNVRILKPRSGLPAAGLFCPGCTARVSPCAFHDGPAPPWSKPSTRPASLQPPPGLWHPGIHPSATGLPPMPSGPPPPPPPKLQNGCAPKSFLEEASTIAGSPRCSAFSDDPESPEPGTGTLTGAEAAPNKASDLRRAPSATPARRFNVGNSARSNHGWRLMVRGAVDHNNTNNAGRPVFAGVSRHARFGHTDTRPR